MGIISKITIKCDGGYEEAWLKDVIEIISEMQKKGETHYSVHGYDEHGFFRNIEINLDA